jgi:hypothetical protein
VPGSGIRREQEKHSPPSAGFFSPEFDVFGKASFGQSFEAAGRRRVLVSR